MKMLKKMIMFAAVAGLVFAAAGRAELLTDNFDTPQDYKSSLAGTIWDGLKLTAAVPTGSIVACETNSYPGALTFTTSATEGNVDAAILYKMVPADTDFEATVKMVDGNWVPYAMGPVAWHSAGLAAVLDVDDWVSNYYFSHPEWTATFIGRSCDDGAENNLNTDAGGNNIDTYPYTKLARVGNDFIRYYSADGETWTEYSRHTRDDMAGADLEVGLRHAMHSGDTASAIFDEFTLYIPSGPPTLAHGPKPRGEAVPHCGVVLSWSPGVYADKHDVYFGEDFDDVNDANRASHPGLMYYSENQDATSYGLLDCLELSKTYFWRIDEVNTSEPNLWKGNVWSFTVLDNLVVDDMESYDESTQWIFDTWKDGIGDVDCTGGNGTGSALKLNQSIVPDGKVMEYTYDNDGQVTLPCDPQPQEARDYYSVTKANVADLASGIGSDWTVGGAKILSLQFYGNTENPIESMWVELTDGAGAKATVTYGDYTDEDPCDIDKTSWHEWNIDLQDFADGGVSLPNVSSIAIGIGNPDAASPGGTGLMYFDDIRLYGPRCMRKPLASEGNLNDDCAIDFRDFAIMAEYYLVPGMWP